MLYINETNLTDDKLHKEGIIYELIENTLSITRGGTVVTEDNIVSESMVLKQSICDEDKLKFGGGIASEFSIQLMDTESLNIATMLKKGQLIYVTLTQKYYVNETESTKSWRIFVGYIDSVKPLSNDKHVYELIAYDYMFNLNKADHPSPNAFFRKFINDAGDEKEKFESLVRSCFQFYPNFYNFNTTSYGNFSSDLTFLNPPFAADPQQFTRGDMLRWLCEIEGSFCIFSASRNRFLKIELQSDNIEKYDFYEKLETDNVEIQLYDSVLFLGSEKTGTTDTIQSCKNDTEKNNKLMVATLNENGTFVNYSFYNEGATNYPQVELNSYDLTENICAWDYRLSQSYSYDNISAFYKATGNTTYIPFTATVDGRPWVEVGDSVQFSVPKTNLYGEYIDSSGNVVETYEEADKEIITSYVFSRTLKGIKALTDEFETRGDM